MAVDSCQLAVGMQNVMPTLAKTNKNVIQIRKLAAIHIELFYIFSLFINK